MTTSYVKNIVPTKNKPNVVGVYDRFKRIFTENVEELITSNQYYTLSREVFFVTYEKLLITKMVFNDGTYAYSKKEKLAVEEENRILNDIEKNEKKHWHSYISPNFIELMKKSIRIKNYEYEVETHEWINEWHQTFCSSPFLSQFSNCSSFDSIDVSTAYGLRMNSFYGSTPIVIFFPSGCWFVVYAHGKSVLSDIFKALGLDNVIDQYGRIFSFTPYQKQYCKMIDYEITNAKIFPVEICKIIFSYVSFWKTSVMPYDTTFEQYACFQYYLNEQIMCCFFSDTLITVNAAFFYRNDHLITRLSDVYTEGLESYNVKVMKTISEDRLYSIFPYPSAYGPFQNINLKTGNHAILNEQPTIGNVLGKVNNYITQKERVDVCFQSKCWICGDDSCIGDCVCPFCGGRDAMDCVVCNTCFRSLSYCDCQNSCGVCHMGTCLCQEICTSCSNNFKGCMCEAFASDKVAYNKPNAVKKEKEIDEKETKFLYQPFKPKFLKNFDQKDNLLYGLSHCVNMNAPEDKLHAMETTSNLEILDNVGTIMDIFSAFIPNEITLSIPFKVISIMFHKLSQHLITMFNTSLARRTAIMQYLMQQEINNVDDIPAEMTKLIKDGDSISMSEMIKAGLKIVTQTILELKLKGVAQYDNSQAMIKSLSTMWTFQSKCTKCNQEPCKCFKERFLSSMKSFLKKKEENDIKMEKDGSFEYEKHKYIPKAMTYDKAVIFEGNNEYIILIEKHLIFNHLWSSRKEVAFSASDVIAAAQKLEVLEEKVKAFLKDETNADPLLKRNISFLSKNLKSIEHLNPSFVSKLKEKTKDFSKPIVEFTKSLATFKKWKDMFEAVKKIVTDVKNISILVLMVFTHALTYVVGFGIGKSQVVRGSKPILGINMTTRKILGKNAANYFHMQHYDKNTHSSYYLLTEVSFVDKNINESYFRIDSKFAGKIFPTRVAKKMEVIDHFMQFTANVHVDSEEFESSSMDTIRQELLQQQDDEEERKTQARYYIKGKYGQEVVNLSKEEQIQFLTEKLQEYERMMQNDTTIPEYAQAFDYLNKKEQNLYNTKDQMENHDYSDIFPKEEIDVAIDDTSFESKAGNSMIEDKIMDHVIPVKVNGIIIGYALRVNIEGNIGFMSLAHVVAEPNAYIENESVRCAFNDISNHAQPAQISLTNSSDNNIMEAIIIVYFKNVVKGPSLSLDKFDFNGDMGIYNTLGIGRYKQKSFQTTTDFNNFSYNLTTAAGDCGMPIIGVDSEGKTKIVGMHTYGGSNVTMNACMALKGSQFIAIKLNKDKVFHLLKGSNSAYVKLRHIAKIQKSLKDLMIYLNLILT